ncbi:glycosyltransferase [Loigolactobacillus jiayinensis]|uniref:Glycosyltransferase n=1 Tax=Loigolactobacillus jiayinensis TaxID=2486016 RepID=A0ABW1RDM1_9LACO|nr:glycosyltransferase [Loigolactobacillus jiayinensis]
MNYFISGMLYYRLSGIEIVEVKRLKLFKQHQVACKIATLKYNNYMHVNLPVYDLQDADVVNLYDYFQQAEKVTEPATVITDLNVDKSFTQEQPDEITFIFKQADVQRLEIKVFAAEEFGHTFVKNQVRSINYFDRFEHKIRCETFDTRGFLSLSQTFGQNGGINQEIFYTPSGERAIICDYAQNDEQQVAMSSVRVNYQNHWYVFSDLIELRSFFLDCLNQEAQLQAKFFSDKSNIGDAAMLGMKTKAVKIVVRHSTHTYDPTAPLTSRLNDVILNQFNNRQSLSAAIVSTAQQTKDMQIRFNHELPFYTIPVAYVDNALLQKAPVLLKQRKRHTILAVARINEEKRIEQMIDALSKVRKTVADATLEIYGYVPNSTYLKTLQEKAAALQLTNAVLFQQFQPDLTDVYNEMPILILTSAFESFNMSLLEGIAHGVVPIAYDINYGPATIIDNEKNGYLIKNGDSHALAEKIVNLLTDDALLQQMSTQAYRKAAEFAADHVWQLWQEKIINNSELKAK